MKYLRRLLWFAATRLILFSVVAGILIVSFYLAMNTSNAYILLTDGMKLRTSVVLTREDADELDSFFTVDFLNADQTLAIGLSSDSPYIDYNVTSFKHELTMEWMWSWPWEDTAQAVIVERVPRITGSVLAEKKALVTDGTLSATPPSWYGGRYTVTLKRIDGQWKIAGLVQTQVIVEPTPTPAPSPTPAATTA